MLASDTPPAVDTDTFLNAVRLSGVLTPQQMDRAVKGLPPDIGGAKDVARALVSSGVLTAFQADRLLTGKEQGFVLGQYVILEQIGKSPSGKVYKARHRTMNRFASIKVLASRATRSEDARTAFHSEARRAAQITHPNVVTILDVNEVADRLYLIREFVDGPSLDQVVRHNGPLTVMQACEYVRQAAHGLQNAHEKDIAHGSINPANLLVAPAVGNSRPLVKVTNFGLGWLSSITAMDPSGGSVKCDPADYLAPEQYQQPGVANPAADLYSLGCTLFFLLTGRPPFPGGAASDKSKRHQFTPPPPVEHFRAEVPPAVSAVIKALMAKNPKDRITSAAELIARLDPFAEPDDGAGAIDFNMPAMGAGMSFVYSGHSGPMTGLTGLNAHLAALSGQHSPVMSAPVYQQQQQPQYPPPPPQQYHPAPPPPAPWDGFVPEARTHDTAGSTIPMETVSDPWSRRKPARQSAGLMGVFVGLIAIGGFLTLTAVVGVFLVKHLGATAIVK